MCRHLCLYSKEFIHDRSGSHCWYVRFSLTLTVSHVLPFSVLFDPLDLLLRARVCVWCASYLSRALDNWLIN